MDYDHYSIQLIAETEEQFFSKINDILNDSNVYSVEYDNEIVDTLP